MKDGRQLVAKIPNPNAGLPFLTTASEVATMDFVRTVAGIPAPKVYAWSAHANNTVGAEYIIMEKAEGVLLSTRWPSMSMEEKHQLIQSIIGFERSLLAHPFGSIGGIYYEKDTANMQNNSLPDAYTGYCVGPTPDRKFLEDGRRNFQTDKGPWNSTTDYILASTQRERQCIQQSRRFPRPEGIFGGPHSYQPTVEGKIGVLNDFEKVVPFLIPKDHNVTMPVLWHSDLHHDNIFVDPKTPSKVLAIIDWQSAHIAPLFQQVITPAFLDFEGPRPNEGLSAPSLPESFEELPPVEQQRAKALRSQQSLFKLYEIQSARGNRPVFNTLQACNTLGCQIISLASQVYNDGETVIRGQLMQLAEDWKQLHGNSGVPCPLVYTTDDISKHEVDQLKWEEGVQLMEDVLDSLGGAENGWQGWVSHDDYDQMKKKLEIVKGQFLDHMATGHGEREAWAKAWPFQDQ
ncbi:phosphotransferase enzyme family protein [Aspergillus avenaceus]|uniref:Altered inheritance of mitochondria protein 9, mitochondrial n=1 Tax=Aspergillus avenaceus TaxID=36643 RepID=A0A5N6TYV0_ASPAV|nr:phosphotransferase enzyme family protein [Aspergillus avenaceus]